MYFPDVVAYLFFKISLTWTESTSIFQNLSKITSYMGHLALGIVTNVMECKMIKDSLHIHRVFAV